MPNGRGTREMTDQEKTRPTQAANELRELRQRVAELEALEVEHKRTREALQESEEKIFSPLFPRGAKQGSFSFHYSITPSLSPSHRLCEPEASTPDTINLRLR